MGIAVAPQKAPNVTWKLGLLGFSVALILLTSSDVLPSGLLLIPHTPSVKDTLSRSPPPPSMASHPYSTMYSCPTGDPLCGGVPVSTLVSTIYDQLHRSGKNATQWGGRACEWRQPSSAHFQVSWPEWTGLPMEAAHSSKGGGGSSLPPLCIPLGAPFTLTLHARDARGEEVCVGGSYLEARLESASVKHRPRTVDNGDGTYSLTILLPDDPGLVGEGELSVGNLFNELGGLALWGGYEALGSLTAMALPTTPIFLTRWGGEGCPSGARGKPHTKHPSSPPLPTPTRSCRTLDFMAQPFWRGHWVHHHPIGSGCREGVCSGDPGASLTLPWLYRLPHCYFHFFSVQEARVCVNNSWYFHSGDSTTLDSIGNLMTTALGLPVEGWVDMPSALPKGRNFDATGSHRAWNASLDQATLPPDTTWRLEGGSPPSTTPISLRLTNLWNAAPAVGGALVEQCCHGLAVIHHGGWRGRHQGLINPPAGEGLGPDVFVVNTGMHDGMRFSLTLYSFQDFVEELTTTAVGWWAQLKSWATKSGKGGGELGGECGPRMIWRHTMAPAGSSRLKRSNPQHMEIFNRVTAGTLLEKFGGRDDGGREVGGIPPIPPPATPRGGAIEHPQGCKRPQQVRGREGEKGWEGDQSWSFIDSFDMTAPWHHDDKVSDGGHYGRKFNTGTDNVDKVYLNVLLNGLCPI